MILSDTSESPSILPKENVPKLIASWNAYIWNRNKSFTWKYKAYKKARKELSEMFLELISMQKESLQDYYTVASIASGKAITPAFHPLLMDLPEVHKPNLLDSPSYAGSVIYNGTAAYPDAAFFAEVGDISSADFEDANRCALQRQRL